MQYNVWSAKCLPGQILEKIHHIRSNVAEQCLDQFTDRRPYPNATEAGSNTSGLSFPSFRKRSGWNSMGLSKDLGSCIMDLNKKVRRESKSNRSYLPSITEHKCPLWNKVTIILIVVSSHVGESFRTCQEWYRE